MASPKKVDCGSALSSLVSVDEKRHVNALKGLFATGLEEEKLTSAYFGLSQNQLESWMRGELQPNEINLIKLDLDPSKRQQAIDEAEYQATYSSALALVTKRLEEVQVEKRPGSEKYLKHFLDAVLELNSTIKRKSAYSPPFSELLQAAADTENVSSEEPTIAHTTLDLNSQLTFNVGDNFSLLVAYNKLKKILDQIGLSVTDIEKANSPSRKTLVTLFSEIPNKAGYVVAAKASLLKRARRDRTAFYLMNFDPGDLTGIEPLGNREFKFLSSLEP